LHRASFRFHVSPAARAGPARHLDQHALPKLPVNRDIPRAKSFTWSTLFDRDLSSKAASG